jgi:hypothetical protein
MATLKGGLAHDVSILPGIGRHLGSQPRANTSITIMQPPQRGQGQGSVRGVSVAISGCSCGSAAGGVTLRSARAVAMFSARLAFGKEPVVADAVEAHGQHVHQETSDELVRVKPHRLPAARAANAIVLPAERNRAVVGCNEAAVRDGDAMGVTGEIVQHLLGPCEWRLAIDHPLDAPQRGDETLERPLVGKSGMGVEERQLVGVVRSHEHRQHLAAEQARQQVDMDEEVGARGDPSRAVERDPATRYDHVHVWMMGERRAPGVQHGRNTDPCAEAPGIGGDGERRLGRRLHQQVVDHALVLVCGSLMVMRGLMSRGVPAAIALTGLLIAALSYYAAYFLVGLLSSCFGIAVT